MTEDQMSLFLENYRKMIEAAGNLWRLVKFKDGYGDTYCVMSKNGIKPYEEALKEAADQVEFNLGKVSPALYFTNE
jgi:hypothetical protein